jgi:anti-sigma B factor antagonist
MELQVIDTNREFSHIALSGKLDVDGSQQIEEKFQDLTSKTHRSAIVDMTEVTYLASLGIRLLFSCAKAMAADGRKMIVLSPQPMVEDTLMTSGTVNFIPIARDLNDAVTMLRE